MQAPKKVDEGRRGAEGDAGPPDGPEGAVGSGDQNNPREEIPAAEGAPEVEGASLDSAEGAVASTSHENLGTPMTEFTVSVPFLSYFEADVVRGYLLAGAETHYGRVHWNLSVTGRDLFIRLTSEDPDLMQISTVSLLERLSMAVQIMQHFVPPFCLRHRSQNGA